MISKKILYSEQLLQLVLALSLLQVDPINYLEWGVSRIHSDDGGSPWQLEIAQTMFSDYPYMNRKTYLPFNDDIGRFSHMHNYGLQTYLLNLSDDPIPALHQHSTNMTNRFIENNTHPITENTTTVSNTPASVATTTLSITASTSTNLINLIQESSNSGNSLEDPFLHADILLASDGDSIAEQNLADLHDYEEIVESSSLYVPTKNDISPEQDVWLEFRDLQQQEQETAERNSSEAHANRMNVIELNLNDTTYTRSTVIDWSDYLPFVNDSDAAAEHQKHKTKETDVEEKKYTANSAKEKKTDDVGDSEDRNNNEAVITSSVELTVEEMDLIEVLWKQDVDLGYNPSLSVSTTSAIDTANQKSESAIEEEDVEKLKALLELKSDKNFEEKDVGHDSESPWPNLSYTIDTETGEYIFSPSGNNNTELENLLFDDNLQLVDANDISDKKKENTELEESNEAKGEEKVADDLEAVLENNLKLDFEPGKEDDFLEDLNSSLSILLDEADNLDLLGDMMLQPPSSHFQHPRQPAQNYAHCVNSYRQSGYQGRVPLGRTMSMEQRWQDLANLLSFPPAMGMTDMGSHAAAVHYSPHYPYQTSGPMSHAGQHSQFAHPHSHSVLHNASLAEIASQPTTSHHLQPYSSNLGSAVATSMHLTSNSTSETDAGNSAYKMEHDMMYYSQTEMNHPSDGILNIFNDEDLQLMDMAVNEGMYTMRMLDQNSNCTNSSALASNPHFNNTLLGSHMPTNLSSGISSTASTIATQQHAASGDRLDASSDSAVSSMGSERVASLSDGEWNEAGSDSAQEYHSRKLVGPYDYRFNNNRMLDANNRQPGPQKKHQMYGKRFAHESAILPPPSLSHTNSSSTDSIPNIPIKYEPYDAYNSAVPHSSTSSAAAAASVIKPPPSLAESETKYSYSLDFPHQRHKTTNGLSSHELVHHNHTYTMPPHPTNPQQLPNNNGANPKPQMRDKKAKKSEEEHMTRDEKRARALQIPISVQDIINLPMDEFNERLSKYDLSENQLSLIRDIRRRGKNKVAAQNCRKRKLDQIISLADEVKDMKMRKDRFLRERELLLTERRRIKDKFAALYRHVFTNLRDPDGNPYSSYQYSLQQSADGSVVLVPRSDQNSTENAAAATTNGNGTSQRNSQHGSNNNSSSNFK